MQQPALEVSLPEEQRAAAFDAWISGYYAHGGTLDSLGETPLADPPSTISTLSGEEKAAMTYPRPDVTDFDLRTMDVGNRTGLIASLREGSLYLQGKGRLGGEVACANGVLGTGNGPDGWRDLEVRVVWCEKSVMEVAYGMMLLEWELADARRKGAWIRNVSVVRVKEGNHFVRDSKAPLRRPLSAHSVSKRLGSLGLSGLGDACFPRGRTGDLRHSYRGVHSNSNLTNTNSFTGVIAP